MFIPWGKRRVATYLGRRADYCQLCRAVRPMTRTMVESSAHLYLLPVGERTPIGVRERCEVCGGAYEFDSAEGAVVVPSRRMDLETLIAETNPDVERRRAADLDLPDRLRSRKAGPDEKARAIRDAFVCADVLMSDRAGGFHVDMLTGTALAAIVLAPTAVMAWAESTPALLEGEKGETAAAVAAVVFLLASLFCLATDAGRFFRRGVRPVLVRTLAPLDPTPEEIDRALADVGEAGHDVLARYTNGADLRRSIDSAT